MLLCYAVLCGAMRCYAVLYGAMLRYAKPCYYAMRCYAVLCGAIRCYATLCYAMLCDATRCYVMQLLQPSPGIKLLPFSPLVSAGHTLLSSLPASRPSVIWVIRVIRFKFLVLPSLLLASSGAISYQGSWGS